MYASNREVLTPSGDNLLDQVETIIERDGGIIEAYVPLHLINQEEIAVDQEHVAELAESITQESERHGTTGQLTPVLLGQLEGESTFRIIDGFHRTGALQAAGNRVAYATIKTNCTIEDVIDLRIVAAKSHKKVKFSRVIEWVEEAWEATRWASKINASSAFTMALFNNTGNTTGLSQEEVSDVKEWVGRKCQQWDVSVNKIDNYLRIAKAADPALVKKARERTGGHKLETITPMHLTQIVRQLPNQYDLQNVVAQAAVNNNLTINQTQSLSLAIAKAKDYEAVNRCIDSKIWERMSSAAKSLASKRYKEINPKSPETFVETLVSKFFDDQLEVVQLMIENAILKGTYMPKEETASKQVNDLLIMSGVAVEEVPDLPEGQRQHWSEERVAAAAEKVMRMQPFLSRMVRRQFGFSEDDAEDIVSNATIRFLDRVNDGRLPPDYDHEAPFRSLMAKFATYAAIDEVRRTRGRNGQKPVLVSMEMETDEGRSIADRLGADDPELAGDDAEEFDSADVIRNLLPFLNERERRVIVMKAHFGLTADEIAKIVGTTEATIHQNFVTVKRKAVSLAQDAQLEAVNSIA